MKIANILVLFIALSLNHLVSAQTVYTTKTGKKYHRESCRYLKHSKNAIKLEKAKAFGYEACKVCKPAISNSKETSHSLTSDKEKESQSKTIKKTTATQCIGKTKPGKRCNRKTKNANERCYQHQ